MTRLSSYRVAALVISVAQFLGGCTNLATEGMTSALGMVDLVSLVSRHPEGPISAEHTDPIKTMAIESGLDTVELHAPVLTSSFEPMYTDQPWFRYYYYMYPTSSSGDTMIARPLLPHGAIVDELHCRVYDADPDDYIRVRLVRKSYSSYEYCGYADSSGSSGNQDVIVSTNSCEEAVIHYPTSSSFSSYFVSVWASDKNSNLKVRQCSIEYH